MQSFTAYKTRDGVLHETYEAAKRHAESRYADQLSKMAHQLVRIDKYSEMMEKLDGFKGSMQRLLDLADDLVIETERN